MKKIEKEIWYGIAIVVFCGMFWMGYRTFNHYPASQEPSIHNVKLTVAENAIIEEETSPDNHFARTSTEEIHSNKSWLLCEEMVNGCSAAVQDFEYTAPNDPEIASSRKKARDARIEMIQKSRIGQLRPKNSWGKQLCDTLGVKPGMVRLFENGISVYGNDSLYFFHHLALEIGLKKLGNKTKILVEKGKDKHWYPVIIRDDGKKIPLSYWGEIN